MKLVLPEELLSRLRLEVSDAGLTTVGVATDVDMSKLWEFRLGTAREDDRFIQVIIEARSELKKNDMQR